MTVIIRADPSERVIRSVGETSPGVVCAGQTGPGEAFGILVSARYMPSAHAVATAEAIERAGGSPARMMAEVVSPEDADDSLVALDTQEAIDGCVDRDALTCVVEMVRSCFETTWTLHGARGAIAPMRSVLDLWEAVCEAVTARAQREGWAPDA